MSWKLYLAFPLLVILVVFQSAVLPRFSILGTVPQMLLLVAVAWGLLYGMREGLILAFVAGVLADLFSASPLGISSLAMMAAVLVAVMIKRYFPENRVVLPAILTGLATMVFWLLTVLLLRILMPLLVQELGFLGVNNLAGPIRPADLLNDIAGYYGLGGPRALYALSLALVHSLLILPIYWLFFTLERFIGPRQVEI